MLQQYRPSIHLPEALLTSPNFRLFHYDHQNCYSFSFWQYQKLWFGLCYFQSLTYSRHKMIPNKYNRWDYLFNIILSPQSSSLTRGKALNQEPLRSGFYLTSQEGSDKSHLEGLGLIKFYKVFCWSSLAFSMFHYSWFWEDHRNCNWLFSFFFLWLLWQVWYRSSLSYGLNWHRQARVYSCPKVLNTWYNGAHVPDDYNRAGKHKIEFEWEWSDRLMLDAKDFLCFSSI